MTTETQPGSPGMSNSIGVGVRLYDHEIAYRRIRDAAPELLEALEETRGYVANVWEAGGDEFTRRKLAKVDAAIARARGQ